MDGSLKVIAVSFLGFLSSSSSCWVLLDHVIAIEVFSWVRFAFDIFIKSKKSHHNLGDLSPSAWSSLSAFQCDGTRWNVYSVKKMSTQDGHLHNQWTSLKINEIKCLVCSLTPAGARSKCWKRRKKIKFIDIASSWLCNCLSQQGICVLRMSELPEPQHQKSEEETLDEGLELSC